VTIGTVRYPGIKIHDTRTMRLMEVLLHGGTTLGGWTARQIHEAVVTTFRLSEKTYGLNQLRYDLRKLKGHGLLERDGSRYAYHLTAKGVQVALLFLFFHQRLCGPLANSRSTISQIPNTARRANWKSPTTRPTRRSKTSLTCSPRPDVTCSNVEVFLFKIFDPRI
jgi:hypothetical protein